MLWLMMAVPAAHAAETNLTALQFVAPTNNAVFTTMDEVPILLSAFATNDVFLTADVLANQKVIGTAQYCCPLCPCAYPFAGQTTTLQIPVPWDGGVRPLRTWQGWTNVPPGNYRLTARATGQNGTVGEAVPVNITVLDLALCIFVNAQGAVTLVMPGGALSKGGFDAEASTDLRTWTRLGTFQPGNVAAVYFDDPPTNAPNRRFYRSVYVSPRLP